MYTICVLSYNRLELLTITLQTIKNTEIPYKLYIIDASTDKATLELLKTQQNVIYYPGSNVGQAMNKAFDLIKDSGSDYGLITADDYLYNPFWLERLYGVMRSSSDDVKLFSCHLEPLYQWNSIKALVTTEYLDYCFLRDSLPGSNWSFRTKDIDLIYPVASKTGGEDLEVCKRLTNLGFNLAAMDLADHLGEKLSAWGNQSYKYANYKSRLEILSEFLLKNDN